MAQYLRISSYIRKLFLIYDFASDPVWISLYMRKFSFLFYQYSFQVWVTVCLPESLMFVNSMRGAGLLHAADDPTHEHIPRLVAKVQQTGFPE